MTRRFDEDYNYNTIAASQSAQNMSKVQAGATGALGDFLSHLVVIPASTSPGNVQIKDGSDSAITVFAGGALSVATLHPFTISLGLRSKTGAWQVTTGSNVSVVAAGVFT